MRKGIILFGLLLIATILLFNGFAIADIINVPDDQPTIQAGINFANDADTVLVQPGTYIENINYNGKNIIVGSLFLTTEDSSYILQTTIDGNYNGHVVEFSNGEDSTAVLTGFTVTNGFSEYGGGIYYYNSSPTLTNNIISNNVVYNDAKGGGIYCYNSNPTLMNNIISSNSAINNSDANGGGIYCYDSNPTLTDNIISSNIVESQYCSPKGGGIYCYNSNPTLANNTISSNIAHNDYADAEGGGIYCSGGSSPTFTNNNIIGNSVFGANTNGGGIFLVGGSPTLIENTISNNTAYGWYMYSKGGGIYCNQANPALTNNIINLNNAYTESQYGFSKGGGIYCKSGSPNLTNDTIYGNTSSEEGGGIYCDEESTPILTNVTIHENTATYGGGIFCWNGSSPSLVNVTIRENGADDNGGGIYCKFNASPTLSNVTITENTAVSGGGGIYLDNSNLVFDSLNRCNIFFNSAQLGCDLYAFECPIIDVIVDTFTVLYPNDCIAFPVENFTFDILHYKIEQVNQDLYVSPDGSNNNSGLTPDDPLLTITYALIKIIADSTNPHTIHLANGTYSPSQTGESFPLCCRSYLSFQGEDESSTILNGEESASILHCYNDSCFCIENLTIQNGYAESGGGIYCYSSSPTVVNVTINENTSYGSHVCGGGGICCIEYSCPNLYNVNISGNTAERGGGFCCRKFSNPTLTYVTICENNADYGGGIYCGKYSEPSLTNVTISENSATEDGGGICCVSYSSPCLLNCILWNDIPQEICVYSATVTATYSDIQGDWTGTGNIDSDPLFADPQNGDYHLTWANFPIQDSTMSPCIDAGDPNSPLDPDSTRADIGAFYFDQSQQGVEEMPIIHTSCLLYQNYPNPFSPRFNRGLTTISFNLATKSHQNTQIKIYNIKGELIKQLSIVNSKSSIKWDGKDESGKPVNSGIYFYQLKIGYKIIDTKKCLLLR